MYILAVYYALAGIVLQLFPVFAITPLQPLLESGTCNGATAIKQHAKFAQICCPNCRFQSIILSLCMFQLLRCDLMMVGGSAELTLRDEKMGSRERKHHVSQVQSLA